jgi:signal transduction histidine kinase/ActR/RegA family two-component response regulator
MLDNASCGLLTVRDDGIIACANATLANYLGTTVAALTGAPVTSLFTPAARILYQMQALSQLKLRGHLEEFHLMLRSADGNDVPVLMNATRRIEDGHAVVDWAVMTMYRRNLLETELLAARRKAQDALAEKEAAVQEAQAATRAKSAFLSSMSHEIRTPMNAVVGMTNVLMASGLSTEQREWAEVIRSSSEHLLAILNDILDYSKIEAGKIELDAQPFLLTNCVASALELMAGTAAAKDIRVRWVVQPGTPERIVSDAGRLRQVLLNLLSNAIKFTSPGGHVELEVRMAAVSDRSELLFTVRDNGIGMTPEQQLKLFQPFSQADTSTTRLHGGTGLGLSISRRLVELMGGRIFAESALGEGSIFSFTLPFEAVTGAEPRDVAPPQVQLSRELGKRHPLRILVAEDNIVNQKVAQLLLHRMGYQPDFVVNGVEVLTALQRQPYDVVLMDVQMPVMDGLETTRMICRRYPADQRARIVGMTANALAEDREAAIQSGMDDYLTKPIVVDLLVAALLRCPRVAYPVADIVNID